MKDRFSSVLAAALLLAVGCAHAPRPAAPAVTESKPARIVSPYDLNRAGCRVGALADCDSEYLSRKIYNRAEVVTFESPRDAAWQLLSEKIDGFVFDEHVLRLMQWHFPGRFRILEQPIDRDPSVIAVSSRRPDVHAALNRFIARYRASGLYDQMFLRWCHDPDRRPTDLPDLSKVENRDPKAKVLRVGVDPVQEPNAFFDDKGRMVGFDIEFSYRFGRAAGYRIVFVEDDESHLFERLAAGEIDVIVSNLGRDAHRKGILWTNGYLDSDIMVLVKERDN